MGRAVDRNMIGIVDALDDVRLLPNPGVWKNGVSSREIFQIALERTDVNRGTVWNVLRQPEVKRELLDVIQMRELAHAHTHGVARMNEPVGSGTDAVVFVIGISGRPISRARDFAGLDWIVADRCARKNSVHERQRINERLER